MDALTSARLGDKFVQVRTQWSDIQGHLDRFVDLVTELDAKHVIELGTRWGTSTIAWLFALAQTGGKLTSVDVQEKPDIGDWPHWQFIQGDDCAPEVLAQMEPADIVFIDTSHFYEHTLIELARYMPLVKRGGRILLHDTELEHPDGAPADPPFPVKKAITEFCEAGGLVWVNHPDSYGLGEIYVGAEPSVDIPEPVAPPRPRIAAYSIALNEARHAQRWVDTTKDADYRLVVVDAATKDDTAKILRANGVKVIRKKWDKPFRFDVARNFALDNLPDDVDLCLSLDMDETVQEGFFAGLRDQYAAHPFDKAMPWFHTGSWWRCDRVHSRRGWRWKSPCHEVTVWVGPGQPRIVPAEVTMSHLPDNTKHRSNYLPLLELAVREDPGDCRMWTYYARQLHFENHPPEEILNAVQHALDLRGWDTEAAFLCRIAAEAARLQWLQRGATLAPHEGEAWFPLAQAHAQRGDWPKAAAAAVAGSDCPPASHYLTEHWQRDWGLPDQAAFAYANMGDRLAAIRWGYRAWTANPTDQRLLQNVCRYVAEAGVGRYAVIAKQPGARDDETHQLKVQLMAQDCTVFVEETDVADGGNLSKAWNAGLDAARDHAKTDGVGDYAVIVVNNDVKIGPHFVDLLCAAVFSGDDVGCASPGVANPNGELQGWCMTLRGKDGYRFDEAFRWWYADTDLRFTFRTNGARVVNVEVNATHEHPNDATFTTPALLAAAQADEATFKAKWNLADDDPWLYFARTARGA